MNHSAADLFPSWYSKGVNKEVLTDELNQRRSAISTILEIESKEFWIKTLKVYLGVLKPNSVDYNEVLTQVKNNDVNFPIQNEHLVRLISGCAIAQKIDAADSYIGDFLALSLLTTELMQQGQVPLPELIDRAYMYWITECESIRDLDVEFAAGSGMLKSSAKETIPEITGTNPYVDLEIGKANAKAVDKAISAIQKDIASTITNVNTVSQSLEIIKQNFIALAEETNILWWLFGGYSTSLKRPFAKLPVEFLCTLISFELAKLTKSVPGIAGLENIVFRALSSADSELGNTYTIDQIVSATKEFEDGIKQLLPEEHSELHFATPCLFAIKTHLDYAGLEWKGIYKKHSNLNPEMKISLPNFSLQLYKELMLIKVYKHF